MIDLQIPEARRFEQRREASRKTALLFKEIRDGSRDAVPRLGNFEIGGPTRQIVVDAPLGLSSFSGNGGCETVLTRPRGAAGTSRTVL